MTFADAVAEFLRYVAEDRQRKPSTVRDCRSVIDRHLLPAFGALRPEALTSDHVEAWLRTLAGDRPLSNRSKAKVVTILHGVMERAGRVWKLPGNPVADVEKPRAAPAAAIDVVTPEEVHALVRAARSEQDAAIFLIAAFTGLRQGELVALRWRDVDLARSTIRVERSYSAGVVTSPKSRKVRAVPLVRESRKSSRVSRRTRTRTSSCFRASAEASSTGPRF